MNIRIFINGENPKSKKAIKEAFAFDPSQVRGYATSIHDEAWEGSLDQLPDGIHHFVGPDPYTNRKFYGNVEVRSGKVVNIK